MLAPATEAAATKAAREWRPAHIPAASVCGMDCRSRCQFDRMWRQERNLVHRGNRREDRTRVHSICISFDAAYTHGGCE